MKKKDSRPDAGGASSPPPGAADRFWEFVKQMAIALVLALGIKTSIVEAYKIPSGSMEDTLLVGDFLLANKFLYGSRLPIPFVDIRLPALREPRPGDVVIFKRGNGPQPGPEVLAAPGHVAFFIEWVPGGFVRVLGGNQGDQVSLAVFPVESILGIREIA